VETPGSAAEFCRISRRKILTGKCSAISARAEPQLLRWLAAALLVVVIACGAGAAQQDIPGVERFANLSQQHVQGPVAYPQVPPVGGPHNPSWINCGVYDQPVPNEMAVHSMEHGAVWITYAPDLSDDQLQTLRGLARGQSYVLVTPWGGDPPLPAPIVASAWGLQLKVDNASDPRLGEFVRRYANGPQTPEPGAPCSGGFGRPLPNS
jgi:hypothetical protein